ncbi:50S ribosomal protein L32 [Sporolactobacillus laevolacticus]|uniref:Large ribosomal subunit protein bL32 n=1 Tax=Sporolactobacillus laevolacticus DSM 442 TaxID=1395513 RepID=V6IYG5_9BACL|nr:50S ribosomal protein L32 [Sporolactobacillus laevolacticus]EST12523.1 50S ribosomal protein L32 [Sporolactobacillus laevolacticus DSM 442]
MAVPKRRTSTTRKNKRRTNKGLNGPALSRDPQTGEYHLSHRVNKDGYYKGQQVIEPKD